jgi:hypothetical protein
MPRGVGWGNKYMALVEKFRENRPLGKLSHKWDANIKRNIKEVL